MNGISEGVRLSQLPDEMFTIIKSARHVLAPRLGKLTLPGRRMMETPHYLGTTSRGVVPHITQDTFRRDANISGVYVALEDFIERAAQRDGPPLYQYQSANHTSPLREFIALPDETLLVLGARRTSPVAAPTANPNTDTTVSVSTSVGFKLLEARHYAEVSGKLQPDILIALGDVPYRRALGNKRVGKAVERNIQWLQEHIAIRRSSKRRDNALLFASMIPVSCAKQQAFVDCLLEELAEDVSGLTLYHTESLEDLPGRLHPLTRLGFLDPTSPHEVLRHIALGIDVHTIAFIDSATDAGIALDFSFPATQGSLTNDSGPLPLGVDMWSNSHSVDLSPLTEGCKCYACTNHHRAYVRHLLAAKEMLGWVLLQIHNHHTMDVFFARVRKSIADETFDEDVNRFQKAYESQLPEKTGQGPRVRGYQFKSEGPGELKKNKTSFQMLNGGRAKLAEAAATSICTEVSLQDTGFAKQNT